MAVSLSGLMTEANSTMSMTKFFTIRDAVPLTEDDNEVIELVFTHKLNEHASCGNVERVSLDYLTDIGRQIYDYLSDHGIYVE